MANKDAPPAPKPLEELLPKEQRERWYLMPSLWDADRPGGVGLDSDEVEEEEEEEEGSDAAVRGRKPRRRGGKAGGQLAAEDPSRWYTLRPRLVPDSTPHVLATLPEEREALAALCCGGDVGEAVPVLPPGGPTPWPEKGNKWYTLDNKPRFRQQQLWEVTKEAGQYNEWDQAQADDVVAPRFYDAKDRWIDMPPVDDLTGFRADGPADQPVRSFHPPWRSHRGDQLLASVFSP
jgi:hypothetical protein